MSSLRLRLSLLFPFSLLLSLFLSACMAGGHGGGGGGGGGGNNGAPVFQVNVTDSGNRTLQQGQQNATYTIKITNTGNASAVGNVVVTITIPGGEALASTNPVSITTPDPTVWGCNAGGVCGPLTNAIANSLTLGINATWTFVATVNVAANAASPQVFMVSVAGGGAAAPGTGQDSTTITAGAGAIHASVQTAGNFSSGEQNAQYTINVTNTSTAVSIGQITVVDPAGGFTITNMNGGTNFTCNFPASTTCSTSANFQLQGGQTVSITVTGNVTASNGTPVSIPISLGVGGATPVPVTPTPTVNVAAVSLSVIKSHTGNFLQGQQGATYTVKVSNGSGAGATSGTVTVAELPPSGLTVTAMSGGTGSSWACVLATLTCTRSDTLAGGSSYDTITVTVDVAANAPATVLNQVSVSGGNQNGSVTVGDSTTVLPPQPVLSISKTHTGNFTQGQTGATYTVTVSNIGNLATSGTVTVTETPPAGLTITAMTGTNWSCSIVTTFTCTRSDALAAGSSYDAITVTASVSISAASTVVNQVSAAGGGATATATASDTTTIMAACPSGGPNASLVSGDYSFYVQSWTASDFFTLVGRFHADGVSTLSNALIESNGLGANQSTGGTPLAFTGCFDVGTDKRGTMLFTNSALSISFTLAIAVKANGEGFITTTNDGTLHGSGEFKKQTGPFSNASVSGNYAFGQHRGCHTLRGNRYGTGGHIICPLGS
jgi:uncharacterized repeat protein (TIGR01451 family)